MFISTLVLHSGQCTRELCHSLTVLHLQVLIAVMALLLLARIIEPVYGSTEFLKYILIVDVSSSFATFAMAYFVFMSAPYSAKGKTL